MQILFTISHRYADMLHGKSKAFAQRRFNAGPPYVALSQHWVDLGRAFCVAENGDVQFMYTLLKLITILTL